MNALWADAQLLLRDQVDGWWARGVADYGEREWGGGHDHGTFAATWIEQLRLTGDPQLREFIDSLRQRCLQWAPTAFTHGYWPKQEAHHGTEHFIIFLARLLRLKPDDAEIIEALDDAAEHIGNWVDGIPAWYDFNAHRFVSWSLGTQVAADEARFAYQSPEHFKVIQMGLIAYLGTGNQCYIDLACDYAHFWAHRIPDGPVPAVIFPTGNADTIMKRYDAGTASELRLLQLDALERHVAAWSIDTYMDLYELTRTERFADVVKQMLQGLVHHVGDPYADPVAPLLSRYRRLTGDTGFDQAALDAIAPAERGSDRDEPPANVMMFDDGPAPHPMGLGRRKDAPKWGYRYADGRLSEEHGPSPAALVLRFELTGEIAAAQRAFEMAAARMSIALGARLSHGWRHGCGGNTMNSIAFGHGRAAGAGCVMTTLFPAANGASRFCSTERHWLAYASDDGTDGLPDGCAALLRVDLAGDATLLMANRSERPLSLQIRPADAGVKLRAPDAEGEGLPQQRDDSFRLLLRPDTEIQMTMQLQRRNDDTPGE